MLTIYDGFYQFEFIVIFNIDSDSLIKAVISFRYHTAISHKLTAIKSVQHFYIMQPYFTIFNFYN